MSVTGRLKELLKERNISQTALSRRLGIPISTVNTWLRSDSDSLPSAFVMPICRMLSINPEELLIGAPREEARGGVPEALECLSENEKRLIDLFRDLDWVSQVVVMNAAIMEARSAPSFKTSGSSLPAQGDESAPDVKPPWDV